jgi:uncharacterized caspase-like protein
VGRPRVATTLKTPAADASAMKRTALLLGTGVVTLLVGGLLRDSVGFAPGMALVVVGLVLVVAAIANSYLNDVREGYRSASEE